MKYPHVVFIDDGINQNFFDVDLKYDLEIPNGSHTHVINRNNNSTGRLNHSTTCLGIVKKYCSNFICSSIKVLNDSNWKGSIERLLIALEWCTEHDVDIINLSIGSTLFHDAKKLLPTINKLANKSLLIAACSNRNIVTYPASFTNVVGVIATRENQNIKFLNNHFSGFNIEAPSEHELTDLNGHTFISDKSNSCAAPYITAEACNCFLRGESIKHDDFITTLHKKYGEKPLNSLYAKTDWVQNALLVTDEQLSLQTLPFKLAGIHDVKNSYNFMHYQAALKDNSIDTVIFAGKSKSLHKEKQELINYAGELQKNLILLDSSYPFTIPDSTAKIWSCLASNNFRDNLMENLEIPVLAVFDNSKERILKTCLYLSEKFERKNYSSPICTNTATNVLFNTFYLPTDIEKTPEFLTQIQHAYLADIIICGIHTETNSLEHYKNIFKSIETDIAVFFSSEQSCYDIGETSIFIDTKNSTMKCTGENGVVCKTDNYEDFLFEYIFKTLNEQGS